MWVWVKIRQIGEHRVQSMFSFTRVPIWVPIFDPLPNQGGRAGEGM